MDAFQRELMRRSPLAAAAIEISDYIFDQAMLDRIYEEHRGRCYEDVLKFGDFLRLMREALVRHGGSAHQLFVELETNGSNPVDESNFYRKLGRTPVPLSRAILRECTARLSALLPAANANTNADGGLAACFDGFDVIVGDGKKIKNAAKRLAPTRGYTGRLLGAKALVALDVRSGLAIAMSDALDGLANDVPLVPALMDQLRGGGPSITARPILSIWDRQFDDVRTLGHLSARAGDAYLVRMKQRHTFVVESAVEGRDAQGRRVLDEIGLLGKGKGAVRVRRITLSRDDQDDQDDQDVVLLTNLTDRAAFPADDLLALYRRRWGIEQVFQQVTEVFSLEHLIGCEPKAVLFQFAYCLLLYNLVQVIKAYVADDGGVLASAVSTFYLFNDVRRELEAWAYHGGGGGGGGNSGGSATWPRHRRDAAAMRARLRELMRDSWDPIAYAKAADKKPRGKPKPKLRLHGGHSSVQRVLEGRAKVMTT